MSINVCPECQNNGFVECICMSAAGGMMYLGKSEKRLQSNTGCGMLATVCTKCGYIIKLRASDVEKLAGK